MPNLTPQQLDRARGALTGAACGDALGVPYEFAKPPTGTPEMLGGGLGPYDPGEYSDDTQMTVVVADALCTGSLADALDHAARGFVAWAQKGATDIGAQTAKVMGMCAHAALFGTAPAEVMATAAKHLHHTTGRSGGNGSLMRTVPVALRFITDPAARQHAAREISNLTHYDPLAGDACVIWCELIASAVYLGEAMTGTGLKMAARCAVRDAIPAGRRDFWLAALQGAEDGSADVSRNGYVVTALQAAYRAVLGSTDYASAVTAAVQTGHDTDTVAAIAGALAGAVYGMQGIPSQWLDDVHGWPGEDARTLAALAGILANWA